MKIKSNLQAGKGSSQQSSGTTGFYFPPVSRCTGI